MGGSIFAVIPGKPVSKARPRFYRRGKFVGTYKDEKQETAEGRFLLCLMDQISVSDPLSGPVAIRCVFHMPRPKSHYGTGRNSGKLKSWAPEFHTSAPDLDNLVKFVMDCLNMGELWGDDRQVWRIVGQKIYSEKPCTEIFVNSC